MPFHPRGIKVTCYTNDSPRDIVVDDTNVPLGIRPPIIRSHASHIKFPSHGKFKDYLSRYLDLVVLTDNPTLYMSEERIISWAAESEANMASLQNVVGKLEVPSVITANHIIEWIKSNPEEFNKIQGQFLIDSSSSSDSSDTEETSNENLVVPTDDEKMEQ